ncbi:MAG: noncanonical pyrimidine nucleotidase, YjjG family [Oscillospiraceae bacterium]|nr:noncanonical pyrimidine nucleotidase, YjjG family [Oscillospiraceae bacterium]
MLRFDTVLFDADNTLFDFDRAEAEVLRQVTEDLGVPLTEELRRAYGQINTALWNRFDRGEITRDWLVVERFRQYLDLLGGGDPEEMNRAYLKGLGQCSMLLPGAEALCRRLKPFCHMAILTNGITESQTGRLERSAIQDCIEGLFISQAMGCQKPQREFFVQVYNALGLTGRDLSRTVMVGDNLQSDILGGQNGGISTIWFNPHRKKNDSGIHPDWTAETLAEVGDIILAPV